MQLNATAHIGQTQQIRAMQRIASVAVWVQTPFTKKL